MFQEDRLLEHLSAEGNLRFVLGRVMTPPRPGPCWTAGPAGHGRAAGAGVLRRHEAAAGPGTGAAGALDALALDEPFTGLTGEPGPGPGLHPGDGGDRPVRW
ncbi:MAG: hypothetical protein ACLTYN_12365 [Dysosmobacter welbionis]